MIKIVDHANQLFILNPEDVDSIRSKTSTSCIVSLQSGIFFDVILPSEKVIELLGIELDE